jgi:glycine amidinotransferase
MENSRKTVISSWNEWDPLKHVIVGRVATRMTGAPDPGAVYEFPEAGLRAGEWRPIPEDVYEVAQGQMDAFATMMEGRGIRVDRPTPHSKLGERVSTPDWEANWTFGCMPPRDILLCYGNEILEATMSERSRWFEYLCYRPLLQQYFDEDPNLIWEAAPKPRLTEETYVKGYWHDFHNVWTREEKMERMRAHEFHLTEKEPLFDAADIFRYGKDLFVQRSAVTTAKGIDWLRRHFEPKGTRLHEVAFGGNPQPWHIDVTAITPRPGLLIQNPYEMPLTPEFHELFRLNDWEIVMAEPMARTKQHPRSFCSVALAYNTLSLGPNIICVEAAEVHLMDQLDKLGVNVIPVDFFEVSPFGGGLHCSTVDVTREGDCEDYFPKQIEGF